MVKTKNYKITNAQYEAI